MTKIRGFALSLIAVAALSAPDSVRAVRTDVWEIVGREEMAAGTPEEITIGPLGSLELAPVFEEVEGLSEYYVWSTALGKEGDLYVGTGDGGKVFRIDRSGKAELIFDSIELDILSLAVDKEGNVFAGTSPDGIVFKIDRQGNDESFFDTPERYVWSLVFDDRGRLYVGTGEQGKVYRVEPSGKAELFYDSPETNVLTLLFDEEKKRLLLGGDGSGLVMEIDLDGHPRVLFDTPRGEVGALLLDREGNLFAAASGNGGQGEEGAKKKALLYRIHPEGSVVLLWESAAEFIYALAPWEGDLLAGTGSPGSLVRITPEGEATEIKRTAESQVLALERKDGSILVATGNQGNVYRVGPASAAEGTYESETHDVRNAAFWGNLRWWGEEPQGTSVTFSTRSGNTETPDETWSDWEEIDGKGKVGAVRSSSARYLQWKAVLHGKGDSSPRVDRVTVAYKEQNLPPRVIELDVTRAGDPFYEGPADPRPEPLFQVLPNGTRVEYMPLESHSAPPEPADEVWARSVRVIRWQGGAHERSLPRGQYGPRGGPARRLPRGGSAPGSR